MPFPNKECVKILSICDWKLMRNLLTKICYRQTDRRKHNGQTVYPKKSAEYQRQQNLNQNTFPHNVQRKYSSIINFDHWTSTAMPKYTQSFLSCKWLSSK